METKPKGQSDYISAGRMIFFSSFPIASSFTRLFDTNWWPHERRKNKMWQWWKGGTEGLGQTFSGNMRVPVRSGAWLHSKRKCAIGVAFYHPGSSQQLDPPSLSKDKLFSGLLYSSVHGTLLMQYVLKDLKTFFQITRPFLNSWRSCNSSVLTHFMNDQSVV